MCSNDHPIHSDTHHKGETAPATSDSKNSSSIVAKGAIFLILCYQTMISPYTPPACRYRPTCSAYTKEAIQKYGFFKGGWMGFWRILRCNPLIKGGYDPVP